MLLERGREISYVHTRRDFGSIERPADCSLFLPHTFVAAGGLETTVEVVGWQDTHC